MDCSMPGFPVHHQLLELAQTHVHWVGDAIQLSHPLSSPSPPAFNLSQHQGLFQWISSSHDWPLLIICYFLGNVMTTAHNLLFPWWWWFSRSIMSSSCDFMYCNPPTSSFRGISQARILKWVVIPFSRDLPNLRIKPSSPLSPVLQADSFHWARLLLKYEQLFLPLSLLIIGGGFNTDHTFNILLLCFWRSSSTFLFLLFLF